jgi:hypothetical protein
MTPTDKYIRESFVNLFVARQYGPFMRAGRLGKTKVVDTFLHSREPFYQKLIDIAKRASPLEVICVDVGLLSDRLGIDLGKDIAVMIHTLVRVLIAPLTKQLLFGTAPNRSRLIPRPARNRPSEGR